MGFDSPSESMTHTISHTEVDQFLTCERKHWYAFGHPIDGTRGLEPTVHANGLFKGITGHEALAVYYGYLAPISQNRPPTDREMDQAEILATQNLSKSLAENPDRGELIMSLMVILTKYFEYYRKEDQFDWKYLAVETEFRLELDYDTWYAFKPDLIRQNRKTGNIEVVDHKFLANLYDGSVIGILPQLPKYVEALRRLGFDIKDGVYNLISNRVLVTKPYEASYTTMRRMPLIVTQSRIKRTFSEQLLVIGHIADLKEDPNNWPDMVVRTANSFNCKNCSFLELCVADLNNEDTTVAIKYNYRPNSYGYAEVTSDD